MDLVIIERIIMILVFKLLLKHVLFGMVSLQTTDAFHFDNFDDNITLSFNGTIDVAGLLGIKTDSNLQKGLKFVFYILAMLIALIGNLCLIVVVVRTQSLRTKFNFYIVNLAIADIFVPLTCMWIHLVESLDIQWHLGSFMCKVHTFIEVMVVCCSVFTLSTVCLDRFLAVVLPRFLWITQSHQLLSMAIIWTISIGTAVPWVVFQFYAEFDWVGGHEVICQSRFPSTEARKLYYCIFFVMVFLVPVLLMLFLIIFVVIRSDKMRPNGSLATETFKSIQRQAVYMLLTFLIVFCVCWTPQQSLLLWDVYRDRQQTVRELKTIHYIALYVAFLSSAINPIVYTVFNKCFRESLRNFCTCKKSRLPNIVVAPAPPNHDV